MINAFRTASFMRYYWKQYVVKVECFKDNGFYQHAEVDPSGPEKTSAGLSAKSHPLLDEDHWRQLLFDSKQWLPSEEKRMTEGEAEGEGFAGRQPLRGHAKTHCSEWNISRCLNIDASLLTRRKTKVSILFFFSFMWSKELTNYQAQCPMESPGYNNESATSSISYY